VDLKITSPVASTTFTGGQQATITWQDDGLTPTLASFGPAMVGVYVGNANQQVSYHSNVHETAFLVFARHCCKPSLAALTSRPLRRSFSPQIPPLAPVAAISKLSAASIKYRKVDQIIFYFYLFFSFIRFQSLSLKDATNTQYPAQAFSAKFT